MLEEVNDFPKRPNLLSPTTLAYVGDSIFELFIRTYLLEESICKPNKLHKQAVEYVNAEAQAEILRRIRNGLSKTEEAIVRRGRNASSSSSGNVDHTTYQHSTAFEALLGYLYLAKEKERLKEILAEIKEYYS